MKINKINNLKGTSNLYPKGHEKVINKKAVSPVIATILLIAIVVVIALIVFLWFRSFMVEAVTKDIGFGEQNIELVCEDVEIDAELLGSIRVSNYGNVPIQEIRLKAIDGGDYETADISDLKIKGGNSKTITNDMAKLNKDFSSYDKIVVIPVLRGVSDSGEQQNFVCDERHGVEV